MFKEFMFFFIHKQNSINLRCLVMLVFSKVPLCLTITKIFVKAKALCSTRLTCLKMP